jgi:hypothetical protein
MKETVENKRFSKHASMGPKGFLYWRDHPGLSSGP